MTRICILPKDKVDHSGKEEGKVDTRAATPSRNQDKGISAPNHKHKQKRFLEVDQASNNRGTGNGAKDISNPPFNPCEMR